MQLHFVTTNKHKSREIAHMLAPYGVSVIRRSIELQEPDLNTIEDIAVFKAEQAFEKIGKPVIAEDTGVYFNAYHNFPGHLAKRIYLGIGLNGLLALVKAAKNKRAYFKTVICYKDSPRKHKLFVGEMHGKLIEHVVLPKKDRLPFEKIFIPDGLKRAVVELNMKEKNEVSHRAKATVKLGKWLKKNK